MLSLPAELHHLIASFLLAPESNRWKLYIQSLTRLSQTCKQLHTNTAWMVYAACAKHPSLGRLALRHAIVGIEDPDQRFHLLETLYAAGVDFGTVVSWSEFGNQYPPLHLAVALQDSSLVQQLLKLLGNNASRYAYHVVMHNMALEQELLDVNLPRRVSRCRDTEIASMLADIHPVHLKGREAQKARRRYLAGALFRAARDRDVEMVRMLVGKYGADVNYHGRIEFAGRSTPLLQAMGAGGAAVTKLLLDFGANPNVPPSGSERVPLTIAASCLFPDILELLLNAGADVLVRTYQSRGVLHHAIDGEVYRVLSPRERTIQLDMLRLLLARGADPNEADIGNVTALHRVCAPKDVPHAVRVSQVKLLLEYGAGKSVGVGQTYIEKTPVDMAMDHGYNRQALEVVRLLLPHIEDLAARKRAMVWVRECEREVRAGLLHNGLHIIGVCILVLLAVAMGTWF
ncbi:Ankyrin repeat protein [Mycena kentingensis (nom. inval.)]|nr:Ankyrin repeat protein [Mycena kentingensis (nom. inval.)]